MSGIHTPSDMSAYELCNNERASRIEAGSWDCECECWFKHTMARYAIVRAYIKLFGLVECAMDHDINYGDIDFATLTLHPELFYPAVGSPSAVSTTDGED